MALFVMLPAESDPVTTLSTEDQAHVSMTFFGEASDLADDVVTGLHDVLAEVAFTFSPFTADVSGTAQLGPDKAAVLLLESADLVDVYIKMKESEVVQAAMASAPQFPWWIPHTTLGYGVDAPEEVPKTVAIDRVALWLGDDRTTLSLAGNPSQDLTAALSMPVINTQTDIGLGIRYGNNVPAARWYVTKRACALGVEDRIPASWARS